MLAEFDWSFNPKIPRQVLLAQRAEVHRRRRERIDHRQTWHREAHVAKALFLARSIPDEASALLQTRVHQRYGLRRSTIINSTRVVQDWGAYLGDNKMSTTILDRLMHHCHQLEFNGRSYRLNEAAEALAQKTKEE